MRSNYSDIDIVRSCLCASFAGEGVHLNRIGHLAQIFGFQGEIRDALSTLELIGEAFHFGKGLWAPAPERFVDLGTEWLVVSPLPTSRLAEKISLIHTDSLARFSPHPLESVPTQKLSSWMKIPASLDTWYSSLVDSLADSFRPSLISVHDVEVYFPKHQKQTIPSRYWLPLSQIKQKVDGEVFIARRAGAEKEHFWGRQRGNELQESTKAVVNPRRLRYAVERIQKVPYRSAKLTIDVDTAIFECYYKLPFEEERLVAVGGRIESDLKITRYYVPRRHITIYMSLLKKIGVEIK